MASCIPKMAVSKEKKNDILSHLEKAFAQSSSVVFHTYLGLTVADISALRAAARERGVTVIVAKKTLVKLAASRAGAPEITDDVLPGPIAVSFSSDDELAAAQVVHAFSKDHKDHVALTGGVFEGALLDATAINALARLPGREALLSQVVGLMAAPLRGAMAAGQLVAGLARVLSARAKQLS